MRKWAVLALLILLFVFPTIADAQGEVAFNQLSVQLLPEYDQASMLVIYDFSLADTLNVPSTITMRIPIDANLFAVAYNNAGELINAQYTTSESQGDWQVVTITTNGTTAYRIEYYEPLSFADTKRQFTYLWPGDYAINDLTVFLGKPIDVTQITVDPAMDATQRVTDGMSGYGKDFGSIPAGQQFILTSQYEKSTSTLVLPPQELQPAQSVDENTPGRISLSNYWPYILGGLGLVMVLGGLVYYWQTGRRNVSKPRRRSHANSEQEEGEEQYCHQCGTRAKANDRFCRVCGSRLRQDG
jgi:hypothetical protein